MGLLDSSDAYKSVISNYEEGLKEFLTATSKAQLKDVVEDMYTACDTLIQIVTKVPKSGLRSLFVGKTPLNVGLNPWQIKIFDNMRDWMDKIKHGALTDYNRDDTEMIITFVSQFLKTVINKQAKSK